MVSYILPGFMEGTRCPWILFWEYLEAVRGALGYSLGEDCWAGRLAAQAAQLALEQDRLVTPVKVCELIARAGRVCVVGSSASLRGEEPLLEHCDCIITANGAAAFLLERGYPVCVSVSDVDGPAWTLWRLAEEGGVPLVYFHGDNYPLALWAASMLPRVAVSAQCLYPRHLSLGLLVPATGFTDGDRALWLALCCGAKRVALLGMDTRSGSLAGTKPWLRDDGEPGPVKRAKLGVAERLLATALAWRRWGADEGSCGDRG
jgi:uncharacterized Rossmann fold enzyme